MEQKNCLKLNAKLISKFILEETKEYYKTCESCHFPNLSCVANITHALHT
jgi:hypothetical protein